MRPSSLLNTLYPDQPESPDKIALILAISLCLILALSPLVSRLASYGAAIISLFALISFTVRYCSNKTSPKFPNKSVAWLFIGFLAYFLSCITSLINNADLQSAGWRFDSYYPFFLTGFILLLFSYYKIQSRQSVMLIIMSVVFASCLMFVLSVYQIEIQGVHRAGVFTGYNPNVFAYLVGLYWLVLLACLCSVSDNRLRIPLLVLLIAGSYSLLAAGSRGAILATALTCIVLLPVALFKSGTRGASRKVIGSFMVVLIVALALFSQSTYFKDRYSNTAEQFEQYVSGDVQHNAVSTRLALWQGGLNIWSQQPVFGTGIGDGQHDLDKLIADGEVPLATASYAIFHNIYVDVLATTGLTGFAAMLFGIFLLPGIFFWRTLSNSHRQSQVFVGLAGLGVVAFNLFFGLFNSWLFLRNLPLSLVLLLLLISASEIFSEPA